MIKYSEIACLMSKYYIIYKDSLWKFFESNINISLKVYSDNGITLKKTLTD